MPGYDRSRIVGVSEEDLEEFTCGICLEIFIKPTVTQCCGQTFCFDCINGWLQEKNTCPNDRKTLTTDQLKSPPKMVSNLLSNMKIKCDFHEKGCNFVIKISELEKHKQSVCLFNPFRNCCNCGQNSLNHSDKDCIKSLVEKLDGIQKEYNLFRQQKERDQIESDSYVSEVLLKYERLQIEFDRYERLNAGLKSTITELEAKIRSMESNSNNIPAEKPIPKPDNPEKNELIDKFLDQGIITRKVANVMKNVDRANYCTTQPYLDRPQHIGFNINISAPHMHARILEYLKDQLFDGAKALDIGSGSGYVTACMAVMVGPKGKVIGIDCVKEIVDISVQNVKKDHANFIESNRIKFVVGDGKLGYSPEAPFDVIHVGAASPTLPQKLIEQLKRGGRLIVPIGNDKETQYLTQIDKMRDGTIKQERLISVVFQSLT